MGVYIGAIMFIIVCIAFIAQGAWFMLIFTLPPAVLFVYASFGGFDDKKK